MIAPRPLPVADVSQSAIGFVLVYGAFLFERYQK
jgi:hypothetical protein